MSGKFKSRAVLMSARANVFYIQKARVCLDGDRVVYLTSDGNMDVMFNIPDKNTAFVLLGKGTSITDAAARRLAESGVLVGFCGTGGSPLFSLASHVFIEPYSEYRPMEYMQRWVLMWMDEAKRLEIAKLFLMERISWVERSWKSFDLEVPQPMIERFKSRISASTDVTQLLSSEAEWAKGIYALLAKKFSINDFTRDEGAGRKTTKVDVVNSLIDHGNYIAYGYSAVVLTTLGISYAFPLLHGKTRRGALVFDVADLFKDAIVMPLAFAHGKNGSRDQDFRDELIEHCFNEKLMETVFETIKKHL